MNRTIIVVIVVVVLLVAAFLVGRRIYFSLTAGERAKQFEQAFPPGAGPGAAIGRLKQMPSQR